MITEYGVNSHAHDALPTTGEMRPTLKHRWFPHSWFFSASARTKTHHQLLKTKHPWIIQRVKLTVSKHGVSCSPAAQVELSSYGTIWNSAHHISPVFLASLFQSASTNTPMTIDIMTLQIATFQYFCVCFVQVSLHLLFLLLLLLIPACDSLSLFVSLPHYTLDWLF